MDPCVVALDVYKQTNMDSINDLRLVFCNNQLITVPALSFVLFPLLAVPAPRHQALIRITYRPLAELTTISTSLHSVHSVCHLINF